MNALAPIDLGETSGVIEGYCDSRFQAVLEALQENFATRGEAGASVAVTYQGETVVDLWGGVADARDRRPWQSDTVALIFSSTKGVTALVANILIERGLLDPGQPIAELWPEFGHGDKAGATVRMALDHTLGVPAIRDTVKPGGYYDWGYMCDLIARQAPFWEPGSQVGYHAHTFGWIVGELIRRASGKTVGDNVRELLAGPFGLDLWCGLPAEEDGRVAPIIPAPIGEDFGAIFAKALADPTSIPALALGNDGGWMGGLQVDPVTGRLPADCRASYGAEMPAINGIANGRGLAGAYRPFAIGGSADGIRLVGADTLVGMEEISSATNLDQTTQRRSAWSLGFNKGRDYRARRADAPTGVIVGRRAFGHVGAGGSLGFADPEAGLSFGYVMNRMSASGDLDARGVALVDAVYRAIGHRGKSTGFWI